MAVNQPELRALPRDESGRWYQSDCLAVPGPFGVVSAAGVLPATLHKWGEIGGSMWIIHFAPLSADICAGLAG
ncbi:hypothetical protein MFAL_13760 [Mycolicibacterium fallax]|nr:hypothetical protein MFAL_13760 [Mycolicibacterium fallax]